MTKNIIICGVLVLLVIMVVLLLRPAPTLPSDPRVPILQDSIKTQAGTIHELRAQLMRVPLKFDSVRTPLIAENKVLKRKLAAIKPEVIKIIEKDTTLLSYFEASEALHANDSSQIVTYRAEISELKDVTGRMIRAEELQERLNAELLAHKDTTIAILQDDNKKLRKQVKIQKAVAIIGAVGAFVLGLMVN